jgi:hypothetical protein
MMRISPGEFEVLHLLATEQWIAAHKALVIDGPFLDPEPTRAARRLEALGLICRHASTIDLRYALTERGRRMVNDGTSSFVLAELVERVAGFYRWPVTCPTCGRDVDTTRAHVLVRDPAEELTDDDAFVCVLHLGVCAEKYEEEFERAFGARKEAPHVQG